MSKSEIVGDFSRGKNNRHQSQGKLIPLFPKDPKWAEDDHHIPTSKLTSIYVVALPSYRIFWRITGRIFQFLWYMFYLLMGLIKDRLFSIFSGSYAKVRVHKGALRLKRSLVSLGGAMIKVGQQLSLRLDLLPDEYCHELSSLQDQVPFFPKAKAFKIVEEELGRPIHQVFRNGTLQPLGSGSVACVYKAYLLDGTVVAVKIRRPKVLEVFSADLQVMDLFFGILEFMTVVRRGMTENFRSELRNILMDELNFKLEARYQELARKYLRKRKKLKVTAPKVFFRYSSEKLITSSYKSGIWMSDILKAIENNDTVYLRELQEKNINPQTVAKQLIRICHYSFFECPFFHADPHPGNILVRPGNKLVLVDWGACGVFNISQRNLMEQMYFAYANEDVGRMVESVIGLLGALPPIDVDALVKHMEKDWWYGYYGIKSKNAEWWERTSMRLWLSMLKLLRKFEIPVPAHVLHMIRATLLYDTVAARLYPRINVFKEYKKYLKGASKKVKKDSLEESLRYALLGPGDESVIRLQRLRDLANTSFFKLQSFLNNEAFYQYASLPNKVFFFVSSIFRVLYHSMVGGLVGLAIYFLLFKGSLRGALDSLVLIDSYVLHLVDGLDPSSGNSFFLGEGEASIHGVRIAMLWLLFTLFILFLHLRQTHFRFKDHDRKD